MSQTSSTRALEKGLSTDHKVKKLGLSEEGKPFNGTMSLFLQILDQETF